MKKRSYKQNCSLAFASDLLGERWTLLLFRELLIQPCRFKQLNQWLAGMGTNLLTNRLKELEHDGMIEKLDPESKRSPYQLSKTGIDVEPIILSLIRWGYLHGETQQDYAHFDHWDLLAMKAFFNPTLGNKTACLQFDHPTLNAWVKVSSEGFSHGMGFNESAKITINTNIQTFQQALTSGQYVENTEVKNFIQWFEVPERELQQF